MRVLLTLSSSGQSCITLPHSTEIHFAYLLQVQQMAKKDERLKLISEVLNGIKVPCQSPFSVEDECTYSWFSSLSIGDQVVCMGDSFPEANC